MKKIIFILFSALLLSNGLFSQTAKKFKKQADDFFDDKNYAAAIENYTKSNELEINNFDVLYNRALAYEYTKDFQKAIADFAACSKIKPKEKESYLKLGSIYTNLGDYANANKHYDELLTYDKNNLDALMSSAVNHMKLKQYEQASSKMDIAMVEDPRSEIPYYYKALAKDSLKDYPAAIQFYQKAIMTYKNMAKNKLYYKAYYFNIGVALNKIKEYDRSLENYNTGLTVDEGDSILPKNYVGYYLRSITHYDKGDYKSAFDDLNKAIYLEPKDAILFYQRGIVLKKTHEYNNAISDFTKCLLMNEKLHMAHFLKAQCLMELANFKGTIAECKKYLELSKNDKDAVALLKDAEEKNYNANRESDAPVIKWFYPFVDQNNFINVYANQVNAVLEGEVADKSLIKSISVNGRNLPFNAEDVNPQFRFKIPTDNLKKIELLVTDIYNNTSSKMVKVGKIVSDTRLVVNMEGFILANDGSNNPIANKNIFITNQKGEQFLATTTDEKGHFVFRNLALDKDYLIEIEGQDDISLNTKGFILADKGGKPVLKSTLAGKNKFNFELLQTDFVALSLMEIDDVAMTINVAGKIFALMPDRTPLNNLTLQLVKANGDVLLKKTDLNGFFNFLNVSPTEEFSFKIDEAESKNINATTIVITSVSGQIIKTIQKNQYGFFEYKLLDIEKSQMATIAEPDPWMKITTLSAEKKQLEIIENIYYESGSAALPKAAEDILMKAVEALKANPKLTLEIESHTDAIASDEFNLFLSQKRAATVAEFMTQKGIDAKRLVSKGMGETSIANHCANGIDCSDGEHKQNRRTIFKLNYN
ncbi:MAG: OmpA family protein [Bacteroidota bacterium]